MLIAEMKILKQSGEQRHFLTVTWVLSHKISEKARCKKTASEIHENNFFIGSA
jgi:hypothetical protein